MGAFRLNPDVEEAKRYARSPFPGSYMRECAHRWLASPGQPGFERCFVCGAVRLKP